MLKARNNDRRVQDTGVVTRIVDNQYGLIKSDASGTVFFHFNG